MPVCGNYLFFELPKKIVLNPKDGELLCGCRKKHLIISKKPCICKAFAIYYLTFGLKAKN